MIYFQLNTAGESKFKTCLNINPNTLKKVTNISVLTQENLSQFQLFTLGSEGQLCVSTLTEATILVEDVKLCHELACEKLTTSNYHLQFNIFEKAGPQFSIIGQYKDGEESHAFTVNQKNNDYSLSAKKMNFFHLGIEHIGATIGAWHDENGKFKMADGLDHILFLVVLLLLCGSTRSLLLNVSGFTIGHSISLGLSLADLVVFPAKYIEVGIAASIAYVAVRAFKSKSGESHFALTAFFGFIHGMGFSYVLKGIALGTSFEFLKVLFLFNIGIEVGQLLIIFLLVPLFILKLKENWLGQNLKKGIGLLVFCISLYWCYERVVNLLDTY